MKKIKLIVIVLSSIGIFCCCNSGESQSKKAVEEISQCSESDHLINATLWMQHSAEYRACCIQAYKMAKMSLAKKMSEQKSEKPFAVVLDIDETVLDNTYYEAYMVKNQTTYSDSSWLAWTSLEKATEIPGSTDFLNFADSVGVSIIFISNRLPEELNRTIKNMKNLNMPDVPVENFYMKETSSCKDSRRETVSQKYEILLFVGDNMGDFTGIFDARKKSGDMLNEIDSIQNLIGEKFIVLPNPTYGTWEKSILADTVNTNYQNRINSLKSF